MEHVFSGNLVVSIGSTPREGFLTHSRVVEVHVGFICSCLLVLPAFLKRHLPPGVGNFASRLFPCFGGRTSAISTTTKTYLSGSNFSHQTHTDSSAVDSPMTSSFVESIHIEPEPGNTTSVTSDNADDLEGQTPKGPHTG